MTSLKTSVSSGKTQIASAITDKGVSTAASATFSQMASNIRSISTSNVYSISSFNNELISDDLLIHCPCLDFRNGIVYYPANTEIEVNRNSFYLFINIKLDNYSQVELYTGSNNYPLYLMIWEYEPGNLSTLAVKTTSILYGYYNGYKDLGFTTDPNKLYILKIWGGNTYMGCRFK